jgi:hypothetical protein
LTHRVIMVEPALRKAPAKVREEARSRFQEIAEVLDGIPSESVFWASAKVSRLSLVVLGWSFLYTLDGETLRVIEARRA